MATMWSASLKIRGTLRETLASTVGWAEDIENVITHVYINVASTTTPFKSR